MRSSSSSGKAQSGDGGQEERGEAARDPPSAWGDRGLPFLPMEQQLLPLLPGSRSCCCPGEAKPWTGAAAPQSHGAGAAACHSPAPGEEEEATTGAGGGTGRGAHRRSIIDSLTGAAGTPLAQLPPPSRGRRTGLCSFELGIVTPPEPRIR